MGLRYRKSIKLGGGFRINISKSGIGYSWGVPGYRITHTANRRRRTTASIPGTGISYVSETSTQAARSPRTVSAENITAIENENIEDLQPVEYKTIIKKLQRIITLNRISTLMCWCLVLFISPTFFCVGIVGLILKLLVHLFGHIKLDYVFDNSSLSENAQRRINAWESLKESRRLWYITHIGNTTDQRNAGGATAAYNKELTYIHNNLPFYLKSNVKVPVIPMKKTKELLIILPDLIMLIKKNKVGIISHSDVKYDIYATGEVCQSAPAMDSKFIKNVWLYRNADGSPDKRHKNNVELPMYELGRIDLSSSSGLDIRIVVSNTSILENFQKEMNNISQG